MSFFRKFARDLSLPASKVVAAGWLAFAGSHIFMSSHTYRPKFIEMCGNSEGKFRGVYSLVSFAVIGATLYKYRQFPVSQRGEVLFVRRKYEPLWRGLEAGLLTVGLTCIFDSYLSKKKSPLAIENPIGQPLTETEKWQPYALQRVTRHPLLLGISLASIGWCFSPRQTTPLLLTTIGFPLFSMVSSYHQDYRKMQDAAAKPYFEQTSYIPFQAIYQGKQSFNTALQEINPWSIYMAAAIASVNVTDPLRHVSKLFK